MCYIFIHWAEPVHTNVEVVSIIDDAMIVHRPTIQARGNKSDLPRGCPAVDRRRRLYFKSE